MKNNHTSTISEQIDQYLKLRVKPTEPGLVVLVAQKGEFIFHHAYGLAHLKNQTLLDQNDIFRIGSLTKQFTAVAILLLVEQGKMSVQDTLDKYFPDFPRGNEITIEHLLTHTSGIRNYTELPILPELINKDISLIELIGLFKNEPLGFEPGTKWSYSNSNYVLLGVLIEYISRISYADFLARNIFIPLEMNDTAYDGHERKRRRELIGYSRTKNGFEESLNININIPFAAGGLVSTTLDLFKWNNAIRERKLLTSESWDRIFTPYILKNGKKTFYGYGWMIRNKKHQTIHEHGGWIHGFSSYAGYIVEEDLFVVILSNADSGMIPPMYLGNKMAKIAQGKRSFDLIRFLTKFKS